MRARRRASPVADADRIPARTDHEARDRYLRFLRQSLAAVHQSATWRVAPVPGHEGHWSAIVVPDVVELRRDDGQPLYLQALQRFTYGDHPDFPGDRKVNTREYAYTIARDGGMAVALWSWEWNPATDGAPYPHMHVDRGRPDGLGLGKLHVPSGRIAFEEVLRFCITELRVVPTVPCEDALRHLDETLRRFRKFASW